MLNLRKNRIIVMLLVEFSEIFQFLDGTEVKIIMI